jgi:hypothetical protein
MFTHTLLRLFWDEVGLLFEYRTRKYQCRLQTHLWVPPERCKDVYLTMAQQYGLVPVELSLWWVQAHDISVIELHRRLWYEANMVQPPARRKVYLAVQ